MIVNIITWLLTILVPSTIFWIQRKEGRDYRHHELEAKAFQFRCENADELAFLPLCVIAASVAASSNVIKKHSRPIYKNFCCLPKELKKEVLKQANVILKLEDIPMGDWIYPCIEKLKNDIRIYHLGKDILYDGAKYFTRTEGHFYHKYDFERCEIFEPIFKGCRCSLRMDTSNKICIGRYVDDYFRMITGETQYLVQENPIPPIDYVWDRVGVSSCEEYEVCGWVMALIHNITLCLSAYKYSSTSHSMAERDTIESDNLYYEDMYYQTLLDLFYTYYFDEISTTTLYKS